MFVSLIIFHIIANFYGGSIFYHIESKFRVPEKSVYSIV